MVLLLRRWQPQRTLVIVADSSYAAIELLACCQRRAVKATLVTRCAACGPLRRHRLRPLSGAVAARA